jgi:hypothetical protein
MFKQCFAPEKQLFDIILFGLIRCSNETLLSSDFVNNHLHHEGCYFISIFLNFSGWFIVECYTVEDVSNAYIMKPQNFSLYFTYYVEVFESIGPQENIVGSPQSTTVTILIYIRTEVLNDFKFAPIEKLVDLSKILFFLNSFFKATSFVSPGKPVKKDLIRSKKISKHFYVPAISTAFWESFFHHYIGTFSPGVFCDLIPGNLIVFSFF